MIMNIAAYGWGRTECAVTTREVCLDFMLARMYEYYMGDGKVCECIKERYKG